MNKIRKISVALSLALGLGLNVQSAAADVVSANVSSAVLLDVLESEFADGIDKEKFLERIHQGYRIGYTFDELVTPCLRSVVSGLNKGHVCMHFITEVADRHNRMVDTVNELLNSYVVEGILPATKTARTDDGDYYAAYIKIPDAVMDGYFPPIVYERLSKQTAVFAHADNKFMCALGNYATCIPTRDSRFYFEYRTRTGQPNTLNVLPADAPDADWDGVGAELMMFLERNDNEHHAIQALMEYDWMASDAQSDNVDYPEVVNKYLTARANAIDDCYYQFRERMPSLHITMGGVESKDECAGQTCTVYINYIDVHHECTYPRYDLEYKVFLMENPEWANVLEPKAEGGASITNPAEQMDTPDLGSMQTQEIEPVEIVAPTQPEARRGRRKN